MGYRARLAVAAGMTAAFVSIGIVVHDGRVLGLAIPYLVYFTWIVLSHPGKAEVEIRRKIHPARVPVGEEIEVVLTAENHGPDITSFGLEEVLPDGVTAADGETSALAPLPTGGRIEVSYTIRPSRGEYEFPPVVVKRWGRFSSAPQVERIEIPSSLLVFPRPEPLEEIVIRPRRTLVYSGTVKANVGGAGIDFFGCRHYVPGDDVRRINWRAYARRGRLVVNEYEQERIADVNVILDARARVHHRSPVADTFAAAVHAAASLATHFLAQGNRVGLLIYGDILDWTYPGFGRTQRERILDSLAAASLGDKAVFEDLRYIPTRLFPSRSQLVVVSPLAGEEDVETLGLLRTRGYQVILVTPDPLDRWREANTGKTDAASLQLAARIIRLDRRVLLDTLARIGVEVVDWRIDEPLARATDWALSRRGRRFR